MLPTTLFYPASNQVGDERSKFFSFSVYKMWYFTSNRIDQTKEL